MLKVTYWAVQAELVHYTENTVFISYSIIDDNERYYCTSDLASRVSAATRVLSLYRRWQRLSLRLETLAYPPSCVEVIHTLSLLQPGRQGTRDTLLKMATNAIYLSKDQYWNIRNICLVNFGHYVQIAQNNTKNSRVFSKTRIEDPFLTGSSVWQYSR